MKEMVRTALYCERSLLKSSDVYVKKANVKSRNEFIRKAIRHYIAFLQKENDNEFLTPALESVLSGMIGDLENRLSQLIFKLAVEMSMMLHVTVSSAEISEDELVKLRGMCVEEVAKINGKISFDKAYRYQKG